MPPIKRNKKNPVDHSTLNVLGDDTATHQFHHTVLPLSVPGGATPTLTDQKDTNLDFLMGLKSDTKVQAKAVVPSTSGLAIAGSMHSLSGGVCHSLGDQSLGTLVEEINPFLNFDVDAMTVKTMKDELHRLKVELTSSYKKDQLKVLLKDAHMNDLHAIASSHYKQYKGAVYDIKISKPTHIVFCCTKYKAGESGAWTNNKACRKIIQNNDSLSGKKNHQVCFHNDCIIQRWNSFYTKIPTTISFVWMSHSTPQH
jgi:hypothetical protein